MKKLLTRAAVVFLAAIVVILAAGYVYTHPGRGPRVAVNPHEKGYVEEVDGTMVLHVKGSPYEMGFQHGALMRDRVHANLGQYEKLLELAKEEVGLPKLASQLILNVVWRKCMPCIPDRYERELEGIADGAEVDLQTLRQFHVMSVVTERGCSVFSVFGKATGNGKTYHGRNFDWVMEAGLQDTAVLILYEPDGLAPFASAGYAGLAGIASGMNMDGIAIGQIGAVSKDTSLAGIPLMFLMRQVLEEAQSVADAGDIITNAKRTVGYNYVVADGDTGEARAYETCANHCVEFTDNDPKETVEYAIPIDDAVFRSDEAMDQTVRGLQDCARAPKLPYGSNSYDHRYKGMATRIKEHYGAIDEKVALDIVKAVAMRNTNLHSVLCDATDRVMWVAHAKGTEDAWKQPYVRYDLRNLFLPPDKREAK